MTFMNEIYYSDNKINKLINVREIRTFKNDIKCKFYKISEISIS